MSIKVNKTLTLLLILSIHFTFAQKNIISGTVSDKNGPLAGANILKKGTLEGTETKIDGTYKIVAIPGDILIFSFIGMKTIHKTVKKNTSLNVALENDERLDEIVITAQGIKKEAKALGYSIAVIDSKDIENKPETDITKILTGKIAGVEINNSGGFLGRPANVIIRSKNSITGNNQPLYIIDGAPIDGSRSFDIDPNIINDVTVLKGLAASTLYGSDGRNGVILITTKTGTIKPTANKKLEITFSSTSSILTVANLPEYQNAYGQGTNNTINTTVFSNWGAELLGQTVPHHLSIAAYNESFPEFINATDTYEAVPDNVSDFFNIGFANVHSLALNKKLGNGNNINISLGHTNQQGYIEENNLKRFNVNLGGSVKLNNNFSLNTSIGYNNTKTKRLTDDFFTVLTWLPRNLDIHNLPFEDPNDGSSVYYRTDITNPKWLQKNTGQVNDTHRLFIKAGLDYHLNKKIKVSYIYSLDNIDEENTNWYNKGAVEFNNGFLTTFNENTRTTNHRVNINTDNYNLSQNIKLRAILGGEAKNRINTFTGLHSEDQITFGILNHNNFRTQTSLEAFILGDNENDQTLFDNQQSNILGVFGQLELDYSNYLYFTLSGRNDWGSTTATKNNSIFYPSASISFIPTNLWPELKGKTNNYFKLRIGYGTSANFPNPFLTKPTLSANANASINPFNENIVATNSLNSFLANPDIKPELFKEFEIGVEGNTFNNFLGFDISAYLRTGVNQILESNLPASTGFTSTIINAGQIDTKGLEAKLTFNLLKNKNPNSFSWSMDTNFTAYETTVVDLPVDRVDIESGVNFAIEGEAFGVFRGTYAVKDNQGNLLINPTNGKIISSESLGLEHEIIGDPNEDWRITNINTFKYKNFSLGVQMEYIHGGDIFSETAQTLLRRGVTRDTENREGTHIIPGVLADPNTGEVLISNGESIRNNIQISSNDLYFINIVDVDENIVYDASVFRIRDISLSYALPERALENTPFEAVSFSLSGNNLFYKAPNLPKFLNLDPETLSSGTGNGKGLDFQNDPSYKQYSLSVKLKF